MEPRAPVQKKRVSPGLIVLPADREHERRGHP